MTNIFDQDHAKLRLKKVNNWKEIPLRKSLKPSSVQFFSQFFFLVKGSKP